VSVPGGRRNGKVLVWSETVRAKVQGKEYAIPVKAIFLGEGGAKQ